MLYPRTKYFKGEHSLLSKMRKGNVEGGWAAQCQVLRMGWLVE